MPNRIQRNRAEQQRANDPEINRDNDKLGGDAERERRARDAQHDAPPTASEEETE